VNDDRDLRALLAAADAALPPPAGMIVTAATLHARLRRRRLQHALMATLLVSAGAAVFAVLRAPAVRGAESQPLAAAVRAGFAAELADLRSRLARLDAQGAAIEAELARCELAATRAAAAHEHFQLVYQSFAGNTGSGSHR
jgi:hypothetical protein